MADPDVDHGFIFDEEGDIDIIRSSFFDWMFDNETTVEEYVERIFDTLADIIDEQPPLKEFYIVSRSLVPPPPVISPKKTILQVIDIFVPLGYKIDDTKLKRAGLDYWPYVVVKVHGSWTEFREYFRQQEGDKRLLAFTKRGTSIHSDFSYRRGDWLVFGSETSGLPPETLLDCSREGMGGGTIRIPMVDTYVRCLNLSVSVGISLYEAARQLNYEQLQFPSDAASESQRLFMTEDIFG